MFIRQRLNALQPVKLVDNWTLYLEEGVQAEVTGTFVPRNFRSQERKFHL